MNWNFYMRLKINLEGFLEEVQDQDAIPYLLKMYLRDILDLDIHIDPKNPHDTDITSETALINHQYNVSDDGFSVVIDYTPKV